ncbi:hypothetical protein B1756_07645 [Natrarchaeobaculum aegyptiacum]|uniref:PGF-CTERM sorting domain-containing protein n=1 Tax=Natrarchaeobaculum aegyptiacum TaxID=745377 RepID=A0A2Z2HRF1_9EURY|nr:hypothetical protein B1756_07645 [Natrarchaeobaculum aegyptiacum]
MFLAAIMVLSVVAMSAAFAGSAAAEGPFDVEITGTNSEVTEGETLEVYVEVTDPDDGDNTETIYLDFGEDEAVAEEEVTIEGAVTESITLEYETDGDDVGEDTTVTVRSDEDQATADVTVNEQPPVASPGGVEYAYDGSVAWQGQDVVAYGEDLDNYYNDGDGEDEVELRVVDSFGDGDGESTFESEETITTAADADVEDVVADDANVEGDVSDWAVVVIETDSLENENYFITGDQSFPAQNNDIASADTFEVSVQNLDVEFDDDSVTDAGADALTEMEVDSNRGSYALNVSADGDLDVEDLQDIFTTDEDDSFDLATDNDWDGVDDDEDRITIWIPSDDDYDLNFTDIDTGEYDFDFEVDDTEAEATASIDVTEHDADGSFSQGVYTQTAGDTVSMTIDLEDTDDAYLVFGDEDVGYVDIVYVEDDTGNGEVDLTLNTRLMGTGHPMAVVSGDDEVESLVDGIGLYDQETDAERDALIGQYHVAEDLPEPFDDVEFYNDEDMDEEDQVGFNSFLSELDITDEGAYNQLVRPLQPTDYPVVASGNGVFAVDDGGDLEVDDELDMATVDLVTPEIGEINTFIAPENSADEHDISELFGEDDDDATMTPRTDIPEDDRLIVQAELSGIYGLMVAHSGEDDYDPLTEDGFHPQTIDTINNIDGEGITIEIEGDDRVGNQDPNYVDFGEASDDDILIWADPTNGQMLIVVDTSSSDAFDRDVEDGDTFEATIEYETDSDERFYFGHDGLAEYPWLGDAGEDPSGDAAYPYFSPDSDESVSTEFTMVDRAVNFDNVDADDNVQLEASDEAVVTGETNVAPGSDASLRITNAGDTPSFLSTEDVSIDADGTFASEEFEFGDRNVDDEAELDFRVGGSSVDDADGIFVEEVEDADDHVDDHEDDHADDHEDDHADDADDHVDDHEDDDPAPADDTADDVEPEDDGVPGFGLAIAVVALLAAAMLALRRQN